ncbi:MAG: SEC-C domain-containing protein [Acidobacteria bacterium]|nr:SEC-C domain-containing protein [Acidobacteriota bacterium]
MAATHVKVGRNDLCACGSGKKFKNCCEGKSPSARSSNVLLIVVAAAVIGGIAAGVLSFRESASAGPAPGKVWSPEHGHFH